MNNELENIFNRACDQFRQGKSKAEIVSQWPQYAGQLAALLETASLLQQLPRKSAPQPAMRRKYVLAPSKRLWLHWIHVSRLAAVSTSVMLLAALGASAGYAAYTSRPGDAWFRLKKAAEHAQLRLAANPKQKISLQIDIAQKRLDDVQTALNSGSADLQKQTAALNELASETQNTIDALKQSTKDKVSQDHPLLASLQNITSKQQALLQNLSDTKSVAANKDLLDAAQQSADKVAVIQKYLTAANNDQALATLQFNPSAITVTGNISQLTYNTVSVNDQIFTFTGETIVKDGKGLKVSIHDLQLKQPVQILGDKTETGLFVRQISIINPAGQVKGAETQNSQNASSTKPGDKTAPTSTQASELNPPSSPLSDPNTAVTGVIFDDQSPQCANHICGN